MPLRDFPDAVLCVVLTARDHDAVARCLRTLLPTLPAEVPLLIGGTDAGRGAAEALLGGRDAVWVDGDAPASWNTAGELAPRAALVLLDDAVEVGPGWLDVLGAVATAEPDAATITALSNDAAFLSTPRRNLPWPLLPPSLTVDGAAERVREHALRLHPRIPTALAHCALVSAPARQLVGSFDAGLPAGEALADFCVRATAMGLVHVAADELLVAHRGDTADHSAAAWPGAAAARHAALEPAVADAAHGRHSALSRALLAVSVALEPLEVTVDARSLGGGMNGTTVHVVELLGALCARGDVRVRALLPSRLGEEPGRALGAMTALERIEESVGAQRRSHVVHRPWQVESVQDMAFLDGFGERTVLTNQDLIGYRTPSVFPSVSAWQEYRRVTADALGLAAMVLFFSKTAAADAIADDLVSSERSRVIPLGARAEHLSPAATSTRPSALPPSDHPFLLVLGNRFRHKNVRFALELLRALREEQAWDGDLVIAGAEVLHGSGSADDAAWQLGHPDHARQVAELGAVNEAEKAWLLANAAAVVYPSTYEGFGLIPFEAAAMGTPCLVAPFSALRETVPADVALLTPWDASASAARAAEVLRDRDAAARVVARFEHAGSSLTWAATAAAVVDAYHDAVRLPTPPAARLAADLGAIEHAYWTIRDRISDEHWDLMRPDGQLIDAPLAAVLSEELTRPGGRTRLLRALRLARRLPGRG